jgi:hypothetical protein
MNLPFTPGQFLSVFEHYNLTVWPAQVLLNLLALAAIAITMRPFSSSSRVIAGILAFLWLWTGLAYHIAFFAAINPAARLFGTFNVLQGTILLAYGVLRANLTFRFRPDARAIVGALLILYALVIYPVLGHSFGHAYPRSPTFGLPCPTTIFTFGILLWTVGKVPEVILVIPFLWSLIGFSAALTMGIYEDIGLLVSGVFATALIMTRPFPDPTQRDT